MKKKWPVVLGAVFLAALLAVLVALPIYAFRQEAKNKRICERDGSIYFSQSVLSGNDVLCSTPKERAPDRIIEGASLRPARQMLRLPERLAAVGVRRAPCAQYTGGLGLSPPLNRPAGVKMNRHAVRVAERRATVKKILEEK